MAWFLEGWGIPSLQKYPLILTQKPTLQACSAKKDYLFLNLLQLKINIYLLSSSQNKEETPQNNPSKESVCWQCLQGIRRWRSCWAHFLLLTDEFTHTEKTCSIYHKLHSQIQNADRISNHIQRFIRPRSYQAGLWVSFFLNWAILLTYQQCLYPGDTRISSSHKIRGSAVVKPGRIYIKYWTLHIVKCTH